MAEDRFVFVTEWYDQQAGITKEFLLNFYLNDQTIEIYDLKHKRIFLKRTRYPSVSEADLFLGATVTVYSRQFKVMTYADKFTRKAFHSQEIGGQNLQKGFVLI
jgi:nucleoside-diphosphate kinase